MKATGIVRRIDDLGCVVIPKEIRRVLRIREGDPLDNSLTLEETFAIAIHSLWRDIKKKRGELHLACSFLLFPTKIRELI